jgi:hypothetical protein
MPNLHNRSKSDFKQQPGFSDLMFQKYHIIPMIIQERILQRLIKFQCRRIGSKMVCVFVSKAVYRGFGLCLVYGV